VRQLGSRHPFVDCVRLGLRPIEDVGFVSRDRFNTKADRARSVAPPGPDLPGRGDRAIPELRLDGLALRISERIVLLRRCRRFGWRGRVGEVLQDLILGLEGVEQFLMGDVALGLLHAMDPYGDHQSRNRRDGPQRLSSLVQWVEMLAQSEQPGLGLV
jgi:hypothetical protein